MPGNGNGNGNGIKKLELLSTEQLVRCLEDSLTRFAKSPNEDLGRNIGNLLSVYAGREGIQKSRHYAERFENSQSWADENSRRVIEKEKALLEGYSPD